MAKTLLFLFGVPILGILIALATGCGSHPPMCTNTGVDASTVKIVNGEASTDRRSTVKVLVGGGSCTGTIIGPHTVLTAAHCENPKQVCVDATDYYEVDTFETHPSYDFPHNDLQLLYIVEELPGPYAPIGLGTECSSLLAQGYGRGSGGELHEREVFDTYQGDGIIVGSESICYGDSGGPLYAITEAGPVLVGVTSYGTTDDCLEGSAGFVDLSHPSNADWLEGGY